VVYGADEPRDVVLDDIRAGDTDVGVVLLGTPSSGLTGPSLEGSIGDVDGDGFDDLVVLTSPAFDAKRLIVRGSANRESFELADAHPRVLGTLSNTQESQPFAVVSLGDLDGDGFGDVAITQPDWVTDQGTFGVFSPDGCLDLFGGGSQPVSTWLTHRVHCGLYYARSLAAGDVTGNGRVNLLATDRGVLFVYGVRPVSG
jgi:hypothetical protein